MGRGEKKRLTPYELAPYEQSDESLESCDRTNISALNHISNFLSVIQVFLDEQ